MRDYLISEKQREALLNYFLDRPYREVAVAVQILAKAPSSNVDVEVPDEEAAKLENASSEDNNSEKTEPLKMPTLEVENFS